MKEIKGKEINLAFIDGQNLYMGIDSDNPKWKINLKTFEWIKSFLKE